VNVGVFIAHELVVDLASSAAQARLVNLVRGGALRGPSQAAYEWGLEGMIRVGPFGEVRGVSKLVQVRFLDPVYRGEVMTVGLRWEATGPAGSLFPVLDADIAVAPAGENTARVALAGSYRVPIGRLGASLDKAVLHHVAIVTIRTLLAGVADALTSPAPAADWHPGTVRVSGLWPASEPVIPGSGIAR
jgi:hypothetical protein